MPLQKLQFQPGINRETTSYSNEGGWFNGDKVRFRAGFPEKIGGWSKYSTNTFLGVARALHAYTALDGTNFIGVGTSLKYYVNGGGTYFDITPIRKTTTGSATFAATNGSALITVTDTDHKALKDDFVTFENATSLGGNITAAVLNQEHQITSITNGNQYVITASATATASDSANGGSSTIASYQINVGLESNSYSNGWGASVWGGQDGAAATTAINDASGINASVTTVTVDAAGAFPTSGYILIGTEIIQYTGTTSTTFTGLVRGQINTTAASHSDNATVTDATNGWGMPAVIIVAGAQLRSWSHDNFGEDLIFNERLGGIYYWDRSLGTSARAVNITAVSGSTNAPTIARKVLVSERDRHILAFGCDSETNSGVQDPLLIRFASQESLTAWNALATNTAGELRIGTGSEIITAVQTKQQTLVITDVSVHALQFIGPPFTFGITEVGRNTTIISDNAAIAVDEAVYWMGYREFYVYNGRTQKLPCSVLDYVFNDINRDQDTKIVAGQNSAYSEVWWFYPSSGSTNNDSYVIYNYEQNIWYFGTLARTAWVDRGVLLYPLAASTDNHLYYHEFGLDDGSTNPAQGVTSFIESSQMSIGNGDEFFFANRVIPDVTFRESTNANPSVSLTVKARRFPGTTYETSESNTVTQSASSPIELYTEKADIRLRGRSFALRLDSTDTGVTWRLGTTRLNLRQDGRR